MVLMVLFVVVMAMLMLRPFIIETENSVSKKSVLPGGPVIGWEILGTLANHATCKKICFTKQIVKRFCFGLSRICFALESVL